MQSQLYIFWCKKQTKKKTFSEEERERFCTDPREGVSIPEPLVAWGNNSKQAADK